MLNYSDRYINHAPDLPEARARKRRLKLFVTATGFVETFTTLDFTDRIPRSLKDHISFWTDGERGFVLCEPYDYVLPVKPAAGLVYIELPIEIAPYCGGWSDHADAKPGTRSLLFALAENGSELKDIHLKLIGEGWQAPRWNLRGGRVVIDVAQCWQILPVDHVSILEVRAILPKGFAVGQKPKVVYEHFYRSDFESVEDLKLAFECKAEALNNAGYNVYTPLNRIGRVESGCAVKDDGISKIQLLLIDIDRTSNTSCPATDTEVEAAKQLGQEIRSFLATQGWPEPKQVMSGNGWHLLYPTNDLEPTEEAKNFVKGVLVALAIKFDNDVVCVDRNVFNPSRITKVPGTLARKGQETEERPYRIASVFNE